jgi:protein-tyrosine phosphatase
MPSILFVCTANRLRSPLAAACFEKELAARGMTAGWKVSSAGTWTMDGLPAAEQAILGARQLGVEVGRHASRAINAKIMNEADLVIVMEHGHMEALRTEFPASASKVYLLSEMAAGVAYDVPDPASSSAANEVYAEIDELVHSGFERMCSLAETH